MKSSKKIQKPGTPMPVWKWGAPLSIIVYTISNIFFITSMYLDINNRNPKNINNKDILIVSFNLVGFICLFIFQIINKWILGIIIITITIIINCYSLYDLLKLLNLL